MTRALLVACFLFAAAGCPQPVKNGAACASDGDCGNGQTCDAATQLCLCLTDAACDGATELCNSAGRCQSKTGCASNDDCAQDGQARTICDSQHSTCIALSPTLSCLLDSHCPFGSFCADGGCVPGCRDNGDCPLGDPCIEGSCDAREGVCNENSYCEYGQICDGETNTCRAHRSTAILCAPCTPAQCIDDGDCPTGSECVGATFTGLGECFQCGGGACLIDATIPDDDCTTDSTCSQYGATCLKPQCLQDTDCAAGTCDSNGFSLGHCSSGRCGANYCGNDQCDDVTDPCPRGYGCSELFIVIQSCSSSAQCSGGAACRGGGEGDALGFCSCVDDADCLSDQTGATCVNPGPNGYCLQGTTCGPANGQQCSVLR